MMRTENEVSDDELISVDSDDLVEVSEILILEILILEILCEEFLEADLDDDREPKKRQEEKISRLVSISRLKNLISEYTKRYLIVG